MHSQTITLWYLMWWYMFVHIPVCTYTHTAMVLYTVVVDNPHHYFDYLFVAEFRYIAQAGLRITM